MAERIEWTPRGVVDGAAMKRDSPAGRFRPCAELAPFVEHCWSVAWDLRGQAPLTRQTLPHPSVHLVLGAGRSGLAGPSTERFSRTLEGQGRVLGIKFLPGGFRPFWRGPVSEIADRVLGLEEAFGREGVELEAAVLSCGEDEDAAVAQAEAFLLRRLPRADPQSLLARRIAARIQADPSLLRVEAVADEAGLSVRALQRLFSEQIGVSPKWIIRRYRLHEAMARLESGAPCDLAQLALELGYADQAHFNRDFKAVLGRTPGEYARS